MTIKGHKHYIKHPGYGQPNIQQRDYNFVFSDNIERWMRSAKKTNQDNSYRGVKAKKNEANK